MNLGEAAQQRAFAAYLRWVSRSSRVSFDTDFGGSALVVFWCESVFSMLAASVGLENVAVFVLDHPDAEDTASLAERLGLAVIMATPGGADGVRDARKWLAQPGRLLAMTLDGPMGPLGVAKPGVIRLARMLRAPVYPVAISAASGPGQEGAFVIPRVHGSVTVTRLPRVPEGLPPAEAATWIQMQMDRPPEKGPIPGGDLFWSTISNLCIRACRSSVFTGTVTLGAGLERIPDA